MRINIDVRVQKSVFNTVFSVNPMSAWAAERGCVCSVTPVKAEIQRILVSHVVLFEQFLPSAHSAVNPFPAARSLTYGPAGSSLRGTKKEVTRISPVIVR